MKEMAFAEMEQHLQLKEQENIQLNDKINEMSTKIDLLLVDNAELMSLQNNYERQMQEMQDVQTILEQKLDKNFDLNENEVQTDDYLWRDFLTQQLEQERQHLLAEERDPNSTYRSVLNPSGFA